MPRTPVKHHGRQYASLAELARSVGMSPDTLRNRLTRRAMSVDDAMRQPLMTKHQAAVYGLRLRRERLTRDIAA